MREKVSPQTGLPAGFGTVATLPVIQSPPRCSMARAFLAITLGCFLSIGGGSWPREASASTSAQSRITDQVAVVVQRDHLLGVTPNQGFVRLRLDASEIVHHTEAKGLNAVVQTSRRILAFSGILQRWMEQRLDTAEVVKTIDVTPRLIMVVTDKHLYGFQGDPGRWKTEDLHVREAVLRRQIEELVAVIMTDQRVLGFSTLTGGFFPEDLRSDETITDIQGNDNIVVLTTPVRRLVFRSGLAVWAEMR